MEPTAARTYAYVPDAGRPLAERADLAVEWMLDREEQSGHVGGLIVPQVEDYDEPIGTFMRGRDWTTLRSRRPFGSGPVLVFCTGMDGIERVAKRSRDVVYVAWGPDRWVEGWAAVVQAIDLTSGKRAAPPAEDVAELLSDLDFAGNNGWHDAPGKRDAQRLLSSLDVLVRRDYTVGAMVARGHSTTALRDLRNLT